MDCPSIDLSVMTIQELRLLSHFRRLDDDEKDDVLVVLAYAVSDPEDAAPLRFSRPG